ncbi:multidrug effflux MFS transporter [uncultured Alistipes sp.]|jgi:drug resistance transporter, bcr/cflA subfamily|uniref:multidrug effflux MFS transporter n=1 Tax=uncultured Alistipes sp. TaxID=538949 RepID=UPI0025DC9A2B|nr:multidrug effflux MFS transporter [uncultured Alistipes sp.]
MKNFTLAQWVIIIILALLTALEPLSIDLYLPGFIKIADAFGTTSAAVQISLSTFLGGFAIGQLLWGPLADRFGRKKPILISLLIFIAASIGCIYVRTVEQLWVMRFIQALGGCGGVVISRAIVTDYFDKSKTLQIFAILALIMGVAPILAPSIGNGILLLFNWKSLFGALAAMGIALFFFTLFSLPETHKGGAVNEKNVLRGYWEILKVRKFTVYSLLAGVVNGALMIYVANGPFLIMEAGGFSSGVFTLVFSINALGLMFASFLTGVLQKYIPTERLVRQALIMMLGAGAILLLTMYMNLGMTANLVVLFFYVFPIGVLFPTTTELAITPFTNNAGSASALFGSIQLAVAFVCSLVSSIFSDGTVTTVGITFLLCGVLAFLLLFARTDPALQKTAA